MPARAQLLLWSLVFASATIAALGYAQSLPTVNECTEASYLDRSAAGADRSLTWDYSFISDPERCIVVRVGQSVTWVGSFGDHPLQGYQGDVPNPIDAHQNGVVRFDRVGVFGFRCSAHLEMRGAVRVIAGPAPVPWAPTALRVGLLVLLLAGGAATLLRRRAISAA